MITDVAEQQPCAVLFPQLARPQIVVGSPCRVLGTPHHGGRIAETAQQLQGEDTLVLVIWPDRSGRFSLRRGWERVGRLTLGASARPNASVYRGRS
jgi:hypothetical protein